MNAREEILTKLRTTLNQPTLRFPPINPKPLTAETRMTVTHATGSQRDLAQRFGDELEKLHGSYDVLETAAEARMAVVSRILAWMEEEAATRKGQPLTTGLERHILTWQQAQLPLAGLADVLADMAFTVIVPEELHAEEERGAIRHIRYGITGVTAAFASTGSMMLAATPGANRAASLLPYRHVALIPFSHLYPTIEAWLAEQQFDGRLVAEMRRHANYSMITGPSKSADIEGNLTLGVHGPKFVHAILFNDIAQ